MQSAEDRRRLLRQYADDEPRPLAAVLRCVVGIATLFAVAAGPWVVLSADNGGTAADSPKKAAATTANSVAESRRVFEERRQRAQRPQESTKAALAEQRSAANALQLH